MSNEAKRDHEIFLENCKKFKSINKSDPTEFYYKLDWSDKKVTCKVQSWEQETKEGFYANVEISTGKRAENAFIKFDSDTFVGGAIK
jgi:hypothetical protein